MVIEGDILVPVDFFDHPEAAYASNLWTNGVIPFEFDANVSGTNQVAMLQAMGEWENVANIDFRFRSGDSDYIHIQSSTGNNSQFGMVGGQQIINIFNWDNRWVMCHELAHALGFWHEQSRADRALYVQINSANICQTCCPGGPCDSQFAIRPDMGPFGSGEYGPYDFDSVMHYGECDFSMCNMCPNSPTCSEGGRTITVLAPNQEWQDDIGQRDHLSAMDTLTMSFMYPEPDWRFVDATYSGSETGSFFQPYDNFGQAYDATPTGGRLWVQPGVYVATGTYDRAMTIRAPLGSVILTD